MVLLEQSINQYDHHSKEQKTSDENQDSEGQVSTGPTKRHMFSNQRKLRVAGKVQNSEESGKDSRPQVSEN